MGVDPTQSLALTIPLAPTRTQNRPKTDKKRVRNGPETDRKRGCAAFDILFYYSAVRITIYLLINNREKNNSRKMIMLRRCKIYKSFESCLKWLGSWQALYL